MTSSGTKPDASSLENTLGTHDHERLATNFESLRFKISSPIATGTIRISSAVVWGLAGAALLAIIFYLLQALGMQSWSSPLTFFGDNWYLVSPLLLGFGIQSGLFRAIHLRRHPAGGGTMAASGGMSAGAMFACCLHNLVLLFPILGASGIAAFFSTYQTEIFLASIAFSIFGIILLARTYRRVNAPCHLSSLTHQPPMETPIVPASSAVSPSPASENHSCHDPHEPHEMPPTPAPAPEPKPESSTFTIRLPKPSSGGVELLVLSFLIVVGLIQTVQLFAIQQTAASVRVSPAAVSAPSASAPAASGSSSGSSLPGMVGGC